MFPPRRLGRFFLVAAVIYAGLMVPWPGVRKGYASFFRTFGNIVFARFWFRPEAGVRFLNLDTLKPGDLAPGTPALVAGGVFDTAMELRSRKAPGKYGYLRASSRYVGFVPTAVLLALLLAMSVPWSRRAWGLLWGLVLVHVFIVLRLTLTLAANGFAADKEYAVFHPSPFWRAVLTRVESVFSEDPTVSFVVPVMIWILVSVRRNVPPNPGPKVGSTHRHVSTAISDR